MKNNNNELDIFVHLFKRWGQEWSPDVFHDFLNTLPEIAMATAIQPEAETTPSYEAVVDVYATEPETNRPLNTTHRIVGRKESRIRQKSRKERALEQWEDDMAELDVLRGRLQTAARKAERWLTLNQDEKESAKLEDLFSAVDKATLERVYNGEFEEYQRILDAIIVNPEKLLPQISGRLKSKDRELQKCILNRSRIGPDGLVFFVPPELVD